MKSSLFILSCFLFVSFIKPAIGQDIHYTNFDFSPTYLNPAQVGMFKGTYRVSGVYRQQFSSFIIEAFESPFVAIDAPLNYAFGKNDWIGIGISLYSDQAGDISLVNQGVLLSLAYHLAFDKKGKNVITLGVQQGFLQRHLNSELGVFADNILEPGSVSLDLMLLEGFSHSLIDFNVGLMYNAQIDETSNFNVGIALYHVMEPGGPSSTYPKRISTHLQYYKLLTNKFAFEPQIIYSISERANNILGQGKLYINLGREIRVNRKKVMTDNGILMMGIGYRLDDAMQLLLGYEIRNWRIGLAYDITISSAAQYNNHYGALEIGISKIFITSKKPEIKPIILCPGL